MEKSIIKQIKELDISIGKNLIEKSKKDINLNHTQFQILMYLMKHSDKQVCQKDLEIETKLKKASITGSLDSLQDKGIIERKPSEDDRRKNIIVLSKKALNIKDDVEAKFKDVEKQLIKNISKQELNTFKLILEKMHNNLK